MPKHTPAHAQCGRLRWPPTLPLAQERLSRRAMTRWRRDARGIDISSARRRRFADDAKHAATISTSEPSLFLNTPRVGVGAEAAYFVASRIIKRCFLAISCPARRHGTGRITISGDAVIYALDGRLRKDRSTTGRRSSRVSPPAA